MRVNFSVIKDAFIAVELCSATTASVSIMCSGKGTRMALRKFPIISFFCQLFHPLLGLYKSARPFAI